MFRHSSPDSDYSDGHHTADDPAASYEFKFALNVTPSDFPAHDLHHSIPPFPVDGPIVPEGDGLLTAPDGSTLTPYSVLELSEKSATTQRRQRKRTQDRGGDYVPRPPNPFILFRCWYTAKVHKSGSHDSSEGSLSRLCGQEWQSLSVNHRQIFEEAAKIEKVKHAERYPNYRYKPIHKKGKKAAAAAVASAPAAVPSSSSMAAKSYREEDDDYRPPRASARRPILHHPTPSYFDPNTQFPPMPAALTRHRRSSSVPIPNEMDFDTARPIEIPSVPFLALAASGHDLPPRRSSRGSLGYSLMYPSRPSQQWLSDQQSGSSFNFRQIRSSLADIHSMPPSIDTRRAQLPSFQTSQYNIPNSFFQSYEDAEPAVQWTNPDPFRTDSEISHRSPLHPFASTPLAANDSSSSSSAPSPPADPEIPPHEQAHMPVIADYMGDGGEASVQGIPLPFDLGVFKTPINGAGEVDYGMGHHPMEMRPRGLSILGMGTIEPVPTYNSADYALALQSEDLVGEIASHDDFYDHYMQHPAPPVG